EARLERLLLIFDAVYLQRDEARWRDGVLQVRRRHAVEPGLDGITTAFDAKLVPRVLLERLASRLVILQILKPLPASLVVDAARPRTFGRIDLHLVAVTPTRRNLDLVAIKLQRLIDIEALAADLDARIQLRVDLELQLQDEIGVILFRTQERIRGARHR